MRLKNRVLTVATAVGVASFIGSTVFAAGSGYTPTTNPVPAGTPGGYSQVVTAATVSPNATSPTTVSVQVAGTPVKVVVAPGTFATPVQVVVTAPVLNQVTAGVAALGYSGYVALAGLGVNVVTSSGQPYQKTFLKPMTVTINNQKIGAGDRVVEWNAQGAFSTVSSASVAAGRATWTFQRDPAFAVLAPKNSGVVPGATSPVTGKPFLGEALAALTLVGSGSALLFGTRRRRTS